MIDLHSEFLWSYFILIFRDSAFALERTICSDRHIGNCPKGWSDIKEQLSNEMHPLWSQFREINEYLHQYFCFGIALFRLISLKILYNWANAKTLIAFERCLHSFLNRHFHWILTTIHRITYTNPSFELYWFCTVSSFLFLSTEKMLNLASSLIEDCDAMSVLILANQGIC